MKLTDRNCEKCVHHLSGYCDSWDCNMQTVDDVKKEAVNEYIKAVVKELEDLENHFDNDYFSSNREVMIVKNDAIEIVKQGCVTDYCCEWKSGKSNDEWKPSCEPNSTYNVFGVAWFRKCPYCGKKIKVVD